MTGLILQGTALILSAGAHGLQLVLHGGFTWYAFRMNLCILLALGTAAPSLSLPFVFRSGSEKGRMAYLIVMGCVFGLAAAATALLKKLDLVQSQVNLPVGALVAVMIPLLYLGSWALSVRWFGKREI